MNLNSQHQQIASPSCVPDDVIKMGTLKKGKKSKKRFFVLRQDSYTAPARLDCYDSEKRFRHGGQPKLSVKLKDVFNINKTVVDVKLKNCVGIFARDETLTLGCENLIDQDAWLHTLLNVYDSAKSGTPEEHARPNFDNVWDVVVTDKGLADKKNPQIRGNYRFCLTSCSIYLYKKSCDDECIEFPLIYIANYGHKNDMLFLRVGRSAATGSGELWMQTIDPAVAQNIHETMKKILEENHEQRQRSSSLTTDSMKQNLRGSLSHVRGSYSDDSAEKLQPSSGSFSGKLQSYSNHRLMNSPVSWLRGATNSSSRYTSGRRCSIDSSSVASGSTDSGDSSSKTLPNQIKERTMSLEFMTSQPTIVEEGVSDYMPMGPTSSVSISRSAGELPRRLSNDLDTVDEYEPMAPSTKPSSTPPTRQWHLEEVRSYISDADSTASSTMALADVSNHPSESKSSTPPTQGPPPSSLISRITQAWNGVAGDDRQRAHSFGSWNKQHDVRKHSTSLQSGGAKDKDDGFRQRSESFGSGRPTNNAVAKFLGRFTSKRSAHSEDLVEVDFGRSPLVGGSLSGSLSSQESLFRSRTSSLSNAASGRQSWSPKIEQITEQQDHRSPSEKLIQKLLSDRRLMDLRTQKSSEYVSMNVAPTSTSMQQQQGVDSKYFDDPRSSEYVIVNSRRIPMHGETPSQRLVGSFDVHNYMDTSSGYSSTGDCSEVGQHVFKNNNTAQAIVVDELKCSNANNAAKVFVGVQPTRRLSDVQAEEEVTKRFAKVDMDSPKSLSPLPSTSKNSSNFNFDLQNQSNVNSYCPSGDSSRRCDAIVDKENRRLYSIPVKSSSTLIVERSPSSLSSGTPTQSPLGSINNVPSASNELSMTNSTSATPSIVETSLVMNGIHHLDVTPRSSLICLQSCRTPSPKQILSDAIPTKSGATYESGERRNLSFAELDLSKVETLTKLAAKS